MKRSLFLLLAMACFTLCLSGCHNPEREARNRQAVLVVISGNNSLSPEGPQRQKIKWKELLKQLK